MNPTLVFRDRASPASPLSENVSSLLTKGELAPVVNGADWSNNFSQGMGMASDYYKRP